MTLFYLTLTEIQHQTNQPHSPYWQHLLTHFFIFCRPIVIDSDSSTLAQDTIGIITISWQLMTIFFSFSETSFTLCSILGQIHPGC